MNPLFHRLAAVSVASLVGLTNASAQGLPAPFPQPVRTREGIRLAAWEKPADTASPRRAEAASIRHKVAPVTVVQLPAPDLAAVRLEDEKQLQTDAKGARRISLRRPLPVPLGTRTQKKPDSGWQTLPDGSRLWSAEVTSESALGLRLHFAAVTLPAGAELIVFASENPAEVSGPYSDESLGARDSFWSGTVFASRVTVECRLAAGLPVSAVRFTVDELLHRYVSLPLNAAGAKAADTCNLDVTCEPEWLATSKAVAGLGSVQGSGELLCTACLVNDSDPAPGTDYVMTANHCVGSQTEADDTEFYWFYQTTSCNGAVPTLASRPRTSGGADFIAGSDRGLGNDFAFLRLRRETPGGVTYSAWSTLPQASGALAVGIHHPSGDFKRISFGEVVAFDSNYSRIRWSRGITEPGSSGSPLFNSAHEFVGQLFGGKSSCKTPAETDIYGQFSQSFALVGGWLTGQPSVPANDSFTSPDLIAGITGQVTTSSAGASKQGNEPQHAGNRGGKSLWFRWTAPTTTGMTFTTARSQFDTVLAVYTGTDLGNLSPVTANDNGAEFPLSALSFPAGAGTTYFIAVDGRNGAGGRVGLEWYPSVSQDQLLNDDFERAQVLSGTRGEVGLYNRGATKQPDEPSHAGNLGGASVWFQWTAPRDGAVLFDTEGSGIETVIAVYAGTNLASLGLVVRSNDDINSGQEIFTSRVSFTAQAGKTYRIAVDGFGDATTPVETGFILLTWQPPTTPLGTPPANDPFAGAAPLTGPEGQLTTENLRASREAGEPEHAGNLGGRSVWFRWSAPSDGLLTVDTLGSNFDSTLAIYSGAELGRLQLLGENDDVDRTTRQSRVTVPVTAGESYPIAADGLVTESGVHREGEIQLGWKFELGGRNDSFANAQRLVGRTGRVAGENRQATKEPGEPRHAGGNGGASVWFRWMSESAGEVTFDTLGSSFDTVLGVYLGSNVSQLTELASGDDISAARSVFTSRAVVNAKAGQELFIAVDGYRGDGAGALPVETGSIVLNWRQAASAALLLSNPKLELTGFSVSVSGNPGETVTLQFATVLGDWADLSSIQLDGSGVGLLDDAAADSRELGFYRVIRR